MRLLLDTHVVLWWLADSSKLSAPAKRHVGDASNQVLVSAVVVWEIAIKRSLGKLKLPTDFLATLLDGDLVKLSISAEHAAAVESLPLHHRDPFDRLLVAQAVTDGLTLVSADDTLRAYDVPVVW